MSRSPKRTWNLLLVFGFLAVAVGEPGVHRTGDCTAVSDTTFQTCALCAVSAFSITLNTCCQDTTAFRICQICTKEPALCAIGLHESEPHDTDGLWLNKAIGLPLGSSAHSFEQYPGHTDSENNYIQDMVANGYDSPDEKRARPFLGKRAAEESIFLRNVRARPFLGKRYILDPTDKRARPFLGKRMIENEAFDGSFDDDSMTEFDMDKLENKRARPFLGKRSGAKRARPFLGKRFDSADWKRARPFLGKRDAGEDDKRTRPFLGRRARPFLGKRARPFLGKRGPNQKSPEISHLEDEDFGTLLKRAQHVLGDGAPSSAQAAKASDN